MNINSDDSQDLASRKTRHLEVCLDPSLKVESRRLWWDDLGYFHKSLPEVDAQTLDLSRTFLGKKVNLPFFISSMTGGSDQSYKINKDLAISAQTLGIPVGMGSMRILFRKPEVFDHFYLRKLAPTVPLLTNLGGVQIRDMDHKAIFEMNKRLEVDGQIIHLNPGQELFQDDGDRDFRGVKEAVKRFIGESPLPVIIKETGCGLSPEEGDFFLGIGAAYVDIAGTGGTNWMAVEALRSDGATQEVFQEFQDWGHSTPVVLGALGPKGGRVLASGGLRHGVDVAKAITLGAHLGGLALPFLKAVVQGGCDGVRELASVLKRQIETVMVLTGCHNLEDLGRKTLRTSVGFDHELAQYKKNRTVGFQ